MSNIFNGRRGPDVDETFRRLRDRYGFTQACRIVDGQDEATNRDLAAWRALGGCDEPARAAR